MTINDADDDRTQSFTLLTKGSAVSHYTIVEKIGAGGMGEVFLAEDTKLHRKVALKFLPVQYSADEDFKRRFTREAEATARLSHPNIVTIHEVGEHQKRPYFAMELVEGQSLKQYRLERELTVEAILDLAIQICDGLAAAHEKKVTHRDIKPSNILIDSYGRPRILDFGLATIEGSDHLTRTGSTLGTVQYMSPEQTLGKQVDHRTDLFSLGVVLYELVTGTNPFARDNSIATAQAIIDQTPEPLAKYRSGLPDLLQAVVSKLLEKDPALRYQSAVDVVADLKRMIRDVDSGVSRRSFVSSAMSTSNHRRRLWHILLPMSAVAVILVFAGAFWLWPDSAEHEGGSHAGSTISAWKNSIAVLPFRDFSPEQNQEFFCDGITDAIIGRLSGLSGLKVISMTSVMRYKSPDRDLKKIGEELGVAAILEGSVQRENDRVRIRAQLINVEDDAHLWSDTYDKELQSIFSVQDEISHAIVGAMKIRLLGDEEVVLSRRGSDNLDAYSAYMQGRFFWRKRSEDHIRSAIEFFEKSIALDSNYAEAWTGLADAWAVLPGYSSTTLEEALPLAKEAAAHALSLDADLAEAHASMGLIHWFENNDEESEVEFLRAVELNHGYAWAHTWYSTMLIGQGRIDEGVKQLVTALELDPLNLVSLNKLARRKAEAAEWSEAERLYQRTIEIEPSPVYITHYAQFLFNLGKIDEAAVQYRRAIEQSPTYLDAYRGLTNLYLAIGFLDTSLSLVDELAQHTGDTTKSSFYRGELCYQAGKYQRAIEQGRQAVEQDPNWAQSWSTLSRALSQVGEVEEAIMAAGKNIELNQDSPYPYAARGRIYMMNGRFDRAVDDFRKAIEIDSDYWDGRELLANVHLFRGDYDRASELIKELASSNIDHVRASAGNLQASALTLQGKLQNALGVLDSGLVADSLDNVTFMVRYKRLLMVFIYEELGLYDLALQNLEAYIESSRKYRPGDVLAWRDYRSYLLALKGDFESARATAEKLKSDIESSSKPRNIIAYWLTRGSIEFVSGNYDEALHFIRMDADSVVDRESRDYFQTQYMLGRASLGAGQLDSAIVQFSRMLENYSERRLGCVPWVSKARYYLGEAYERSGRTDEAVAHYELFLDQWKNADPGLAVIGDVRVRLDQLKGQN